MNNSTSKFLGLILAILYLTPFSSCDKNENVSQEAPEDYSISYSGVLVGSSGYFSLTINSKGENTASLTFDGETHILNNKTAYNKNIIGQEFQFSNQDVTLNLITTNLRSKPEIEVEIPGHTIIASVYEENNEEPVRNYTGTGFYYSFYKAFVDSFSTIYNLSIKNDSFTNIEKVMSSNKPTEIGKVSQVNGTIEESDDEIIFYVSGNPDGIRFDKNGHRILHMQADTPNMERNSHQIIELILVQ